MSGTSSNVHIRVTDDSWITDEDVMPPPCPVCGRHVRVTESHSYDDDTDEYGNVTKVDAVAYWVCPSCGASGHEWAELVFVPDGEDE